MKVEFLNPFITSAFSVLETVLKTKPVKGEIGMLPSTFTSMQCNVVIGVTGSIHGSVIHGMSLLTADKIASTMIGHQIKTFDQLAASAIAELGNMLNGHALALLSDLGYVCDITPPTIIRGTNVQISTLALPAIVIPLMLEQGEFHISVGLQERK